MWAATYVLVANRSPFATTVRVTLLPERHVTWAALSADVDVAATSRLDVDLAAMFPSLVGGPDRREVFGVLVESIGASTAELAVERATYRDANGVRWAAGASTLAARLP